MISKSNETIFKEAIEDEGYSVRSYSGRGMYGKNCLGFNISRGQSPIQATAEIIGNLADVCQYDDDLELSDFIEFFGDVKEDSMGLGMIVYFPDIEWDSEWNESDEENEDDE